MGEETAERVIKMITVYTVGCPRCLILEKKLVQANISYRVCEDKEKMIAKGIDHLPVMEVDGKMYNFKEAVKWIDNQENR